MPILSLLPEIILVICNLVIVGCLTIIRREEKRIMDQRFEEDMVKYRPRR